MADTRNPATLQRAEDHLDFVSAEQTTTDDYADLLDAKGHAEVDARGRPKMTFNLVNTGLANSATFAVLYTLRDSADRWLTATTQAVAADSMTAVVMTRACVKVKVQVKATVGGDQTTALFELAGS